MSEYYFPAINGAVKRVVLAQTVGGLLAILGNTLIIWAICTSKSPRVRVLTNYLLCAQAVTDVLMGILTSITGSLTLIHGRFPGHAFSKDIGGYIRWQGPLCSMYGYFLHLLAFGTVYTLAVITWERYCSIVRSMKGRLQKKTLFRLWLLVWVIGALWCAIPFLEEGFFLSPSGDHCACLLAPNVTTSGSVISIFVAVGFIFFCYYRMYRVIQKVFRDGAGNAKTSIAEEKKIAKQFLVIVCFFCACWVPAGLAFGAGLVGLMKSNPFSTRWLNLQLFGMTFAVFSSVASPYLYMALNKNVRKAVYKKINQCGLINLGANNSIVPMELNIRRIYIKSSHHDAKCINVTPAKHC